MSWAQLMRHCVLLYVIQDDEHQYAYLFWSMEAEGSEEL